MSIDEANYRSRSILPHSLEWIVSGTGRGIALFFGAFSLLNLGGELLHPGFDASVWWLDLRGVPVSVSRSLMLIFAAAMFEFARQPTASVTMRILQMLVVTGAMLVAIRDAITFHRLVSHGAITADFPLSFSLIVALLLLIVLAATFVRTTSPRNSRFGKATFAATVLLCTMAFPLLQIQCFGRTDYRRPADAAVVFGCRVYPNGNLSAALADRVRCACELYDDGLVDHLIMSGGPGPGSVHETDAMRVFALSHGVPSDRILIDRSGLSTEQTVANTVPIFQNHGFERVLAVSHFFHLPRIKLAYQRAGFDVFTVPASQKFRLPNERFMLARETVALWAYYARPLTGL